MRQVNLRLDGELLGEVDWARAGVPRNLWLVAAVKLALGHDLRADLTETGPAAKTPTREAERSPADELDAASHGIVREQAAEAKGATSIRVEAGSMLPEPRKPTGGMVRQPRPIVQKRSK